MIRQSLAIVGLTLSFGINAATLIVDGTGVLAGATGVSVSGALYDVSFVDGTCSALYSGCDNNSDFTFQTASQGQAASQALLDQVFINGPSGNFDTSDVRKINGCRNTGLCLAITPYAILTEDPTYLFSYAINSSFGADQTTLGGVSGASFDSTPPKILPFRASDFVYAVWQPSPVPLPAAAWLFISALGGLVVAKRKQLKA